MKNNNRKANFLITLISSLSILSLMVVLISFFISYSSSVKSEQASAFQENTTQQVLSLEQKQTNNLSQQTLQLLQSKSLNYFPELNNAANILFTDIYTYRLDTNNFNKREADASTVASNVIIQQRFTSNLANLEYNPTDHYSSFSLANPPEVYIQKEDGDSIYATVVININQTTPNSMNNGVKTVIKQTVEQVTYDSASKLIMSSTNAGPLIQPTSGGIN